MWHLHGKIIASDKINPMKHLLPFLRYTRSGIQILLLSGLISFIVWQCVAHVFSSYFWTSLVVVVIVAGYLEGKK